MNDLPSPHTPVLYQEVLYYLCPANGGLYVDATIGAGGHAFGILQASQPHGQLLGLDVDSHALEVASQRLAGFGSRIILRHASYSTLDYQLQQLGWKRVQGIVIDLGMSSMQVDTAERGFSFLAAGPLDMRFDQTQGITAADLVNNLPEEKLVEILKVFGEEPNARRIAKAIVKSRPHYDTLHLAEIIQREAGATRGRLHPATRTFQALRIAVNQEFDALERFLPQAIAALAPQGRLAVISFHSLEDRIVKQYFQRESKDCICPPKQPVCTCQHKAQVKLVFRKAVSASEAEIRINPRARSARLRVVEKLDLA